MGLALIFSLGVDTSSAALSSTIYVSPHGNDSWNGQSATYNSTSKSGPKATIKNATKSLQSGMVFVEIGTYHETGITINSEITIKGQSKTSTIIDGDKKGQIFIISKGSTAEIVDIRLINGNSDFGGAIKNSGKLTLTNTYLSKNTASSGGAIWNNGTTTITGCTFEFNVGNNSAYGGGAIHNENGTLFISNSNFTQNSAKTLGGAVFNAAKSTCTIKSSNFTGNQVLESSKAYGGAVSNSGILALNNSVFYMNAAEFGGALFNENYTILNNCTFNSNQASEGGAVYNTGNFNLTSSILTKNIAMNYGGAFAGYGGNANINFNRIVGNGAVKGSGVYTDKDNVNANSNWWGSNSSPQGFIFGNVTASKWMVLTLNSPKLIKNGIPTNITANFLYDNTKVKHDPSNGHVPDGVNIIFSSTQGSFKPSSTYTVNGQVVTIYTSTQTGTVTLSALADNQTVKFNATVIKPLLINGTTPKNGAIKVSGNTKIQLKFNQNIKRGNMSIDLLNSNGTKIAFTTSIINNILTFTPKTTLKTGKYYLILHSGSVLSQLNSSLSLYKFNFSVDKTAPKLMSTSLKNIQTRVSTTATIIIRYNENVQKGTNFSKITVKNLITGKNIVIKSSISKNSAIIQTSTKTKNTWYMVNVPSASVKDYAGNNQQVSYSFKFKT
ncbi:MAG: Ig-like domain-containing protein [Methanobacterium sp. ERen5]|nr:MAG: Ig-like domain-containing protein [Methanobacterium sp. ERen5]